MIYLIIYILIGAFFAGTQLAAIKEESEEHWVAGSVLLMFLWPIFVVLDLGIKTNQLLVKLKGKKDEKGDN